jgi:glycosyltransferase A (GT-A) superfamily protein (DUF2064 family)
MNNRVGERRMGQVADWHTAKLFTIIQVIVILGAVSGGVWYLAGVERAQALVVKDVNRHELELVQLRLDRVDRQDLRRLEDKIDRLMLHFLGSTKP